MVPPDAFTVGTDLAASPGRGGAAHPGLRADPVPAVHRDGPRAAAADRPADDQQVLHSRPRARPQHDRVPDRPGAAGVRDVLAQPGRAARRLGVRTSTPQAIIDAMPRGGGHPLGADAVHLLAACSAASWPAWPPRCSRTGPGRGRGWRGRRQPGPAGEPRRSSSPCSISPAPTRVGALRGRVHGAGRDRRLRAEGLPGRAQARRGLRLAPPRRPDLELLGEQLPARPRARRSSTSCSGTPTPRG